jgi:hypothetical protein
LRIETEVDERGQDAETMKAGSQPAAGQRDPDALRNIAKKLIVGVSAERTP